MSHLAMEMRLSYGGDCRLRQGHIRLTRPLMGKTYAHSIGFLFTFLLYISILEDVDRQTIVVSPNKGESNEPLP